MSSSCRRWQPYGEPGAAVSAHVHAVVGQTPVHDVAGLDDEGLRLEVRGGTASFGDQRECTAGENHLARHAEAAGAEWLDEAEPEAARRADGVDGIGPL